MRTVLLVVLLAWAVPFAVAQPRLSAGASLGTSRPLTEYTGVSADATVSGQTGRVLVNAHVAGLTVDRADRRTGGVGTDETAGLTRDTFVGYSAGLDAGYLLPVYRSISLLGGGGGRFFLDDPRVNRDGSVYLLGGIVAGRADGVRLVARTEQDLKATRYGVLQIMRSQVGVLVPLTR